MCFFIVATDGAVGKQCSDLGLLHSFCGGIVQFPARLRTLVHDYGFLHLIYGSAFDYESAYVAFKGLRELDWACETDGHWYYYISESGSVYDVPDSVVKKRKQDASVILFRTYFTILREVLSCSREALC